MTAARADRLIRRATLIAAREAVRLGDHDLADRLFAEVGISYCRLVLS